MTPSETEEVLVAWLDSAEGQEKIKNTVRELWCGGPVEWIQVRYYASSVWVSLMTKSASGATANQLRIKERAFKEFHGPTESAAWLSALSFLSKEDSK